MKKQIGLLLLIQLFATINIFAQKDNEITVKTDASEITIFTSGAQVSRKKQIDIPEGKSIVKFVQLSPFLVSKSILVKAYGDATILTVNHQYNYLDSLKRVNEINSLVTKIAAIDQKLKLEKATIEVLHEQLLLLQENRNQKGNANVLSLKEALSFYKEQITQIKQKEIESNQIIEDLVKQQALLRKQLQTIGATKHESYSEIIALIESKKAQKIDFEVSYFTENATWFPSYEIRTDAVNEPLKLVYKANIQQNTKEDWKNVKLNLSTANPILGNIATVLIPYELNYYKKPPRYITLGGAVTGRITDAYTGEAIAGAIVQIEGTSIATSTDEYGNYSISKPSSQNATLTVFFIGYDKISKGISSNTIDFALRESNVELDEVVVTSYNFKKSEQVVSSISSEMIMKSADRDAAQVIERKSKRNDQTGIIEKAVNTSPTAMTFEIKTPYSLPSDKKVLVVDIDRITINANYEYYAAPKADKDAFLQASFTDWAQYNLLDGEAAIYFENTYVGKSLLDISNASDTILLSLGRDKNVVINRESKKDFTTKQFLGTKREVTKAWNISIKNNKKQSVKLVLHDQVPVSLLEEIEVNVDETSGAQLTKETGELVWNITLEPNQKKDFLLKYRVKFPKNRALSIE